MKLLKNKFFIFILVLCVLIAAARHFGLAAKFEAVEAWVRTLGTWGPLAYVFIYAACAVAAFPGSVLTVAAGSLFGTWLGFVVVSAGSTLGAALSFMLSRYFARDYVAARLRDNARFQKLDALTARHGNIIVAITRLIPLFHFTLLNYGFGLTSVSFRVYVFWSWLCMMPGTLVYVAGGEALARGLKGEAPPAALIFVFLAASLVIVVLVRHFRKILGGDGPENL